MISLLVDWLVIGVGTAFAIEILADKPLPAGYKRIPIILLWPMAIWIVLRSLRDDIRRLKLDKRESA